MNREEHLNKTFPLDNTMCEYSGLPSTQSYGTNPQTQAEGAGVGGESIKENFIDSKSDEQSNSASIDRDIDFMYKWIRKHSNK